MAVEMPRIADLPDHWSVDTEPGICQCCQKAAPVYRPNYLMRDSAKDQALMGVRICLECRRPSHDPCQAAWTPPVELEKFNG